MLRLTRHRIRQRNGVFEFRNHRAAGLFRSFSQDAPPPVESRIAGGAGVGRLDTRGVKRDEFAGAQFGPFLKDLFEPVRLYQRLHDSYGAGRLSPGEGWISLRAFDCRTVYSVQRHRPFVSSPVEYDYGIAWSQSQH